MFLLVSSSALYYIMHFIFCSVPITMIIIGSIYLYDCPKERYIPIYLIVGGIFGAVKIIFSSVNEFLCSDEEDEEGNPCANLFSRIIGWFIFGWFIAGSVWVYRIYKDFDENNTSSQDYCHPMLYYFSFWLLTVSYISTAAISCFSCYFCSLVTRAELKSSDM